MKLKEFTVPKQRSFGEDLEGGSNWFCQWEKDGFRHSATVRALDSDHALEVLIRACGKASGSAKVVPTDAPNLGRHASFAL